MAFYVGQKVVCVNNGPLQNQWGQVYDAPQLSQGAVYQIVEVWPDGRLFLAETKAIYGCEGFNEKRFRPITERKTSIGIFKAMLNPSKTEVTA